MIAKEVLSIVEVFEHASQTTITTLGSCGTIRHMKKGDMLFIDKEDVTSIYIVIHGLVSLFKLNGQGEKKVVFVLGQGKLINEVILQDLPASINCEIFEDAEILSFNKYDLLKIMEKDFGLTKAIIDSLAMKIRRLYRQLKNTSNMVKCDKRVAAKLWKLSGDFGKPCEAGVAIDMDLTITYLADMLGSTRETVSRQLKLLQELGLVIIHESRFIIPQRHLLIKYFKTP